MFGRMALFEVMLLTLFSLAFARNDSFSSKADESLVFRDVNYRLSSNVSPLSYEIKIISCFIEPNFSFNGKSEIRIRVLATTRKVILHAKKLMVENIYITSNGRKKMNSSTHTIEEVTDFLTIEFGDDLRVNREYTLILEYWGVLNDEPSGFFRSSYMNAKGKKVWFAATQFEALGARQAFPCFDEPALKATFSISIKHWNKYHALSNMHIIKRELAADDSEQTWTTFATTPKMSTYLVAFVISDFVKLENEAHDFRIWAREEVIQNGKYALDIGSKALEFIEEYTGISRNSTQMLKIDNIAIPEFEVNAMENWGLIIYDETNLLLRKDDTFSDQEFIAIVVCHEITHQWFGNLVTPERWQYIWLSEGLANYFEAIFAEKIDHIWKSNDLYVVFDLQEQAFVFDSDPQESVAMNHRTEEPDEIIRKIISSISFYKAGSIFRMISHILTESKFQKALRNYLRKMSYKSATPNDLFIELSAEYHGTRLKQAKLRSAFENWADTPGFPVITVTRDYANNTAVVTQERFLIYEDPSHNERYWIPINFAQNKFDFYDTKASYWFNPNDTSINVRGLKNNQWAIFNNQHFGYYRVNYDEKNWGLIINALNSDQYENIHILNRGQLLDDAFKLAETSRLSWSIALGVASYLKKEKNYIPWKSASSGLLSLFEILFSTEYFNDYTSYVLNLLDDLEATLGYEMSSKDDHLEKYLRLQITSFGCHFGSKYCSRYGYSKIEEWFRNTTLNPYPAPIYFCAGVRDLDQNEWDQLFDKYLEEEDEILASALACSSNKRILKHYLHLAVNSSLSIDSRFRLVSDIFTSKYTSVDVALNFIMQNPKKINTITTENQDKTEFLLLQLGKKTISQQQIDKLKHFMKKIEYIGEKVANRVILSAETNMIRVRAIQERMRKDLSEFLRNQKISSGRSSKRSNHMNTISDDFV